MVLPTRVAPSMSISLETPSAELKSQVRTGAPEALRSYRRSTLDSSSATTMKPLPASTAAEASLEPVR